MGGDSNESQRERELKRMGKAELVRLAFSQETHIRNLQNRIAEIEKEARDIAQDRRIEISEAGSIAEASIRITDVFEEAQKAADVYLFNIRELEEQHKREVDIRMKEAQDEAAGIVEEARKQAEALVKEGRAEGARIRAEASLAASKREKEADKYYENIKERTRSALMNLSRFNEDYEKLKQIAEHQPEESMLVISSEDGKARSDVGTEDGTIDAAKLYQSVDSLLESQKEAS